MNKHAPESSYVRDTYDSLLARLPEGYSKFRWDETAVSRFHYRQSRRALLRGLASVRAKVGRALEIGGGAGAWTPFFVERADQLDFVDISQNMIREAKVALAQFRHIQYTHADFLGWEPEPATYDLVVSIRNIEYMNDKRAAIARVARGLRSGGTFIVSTKSPNFDWKGYFAGKTLHGGQIPITELVALLQESGFSVEHIYPAILGKLIRYAPARAVWDGLQMVLLRMPQALMPISLLKYLSESFLVVARRI